MRSALAHVPKDQQAVVAATLRQAFSRADQAAARQVWRQVADQLRPRRPKPRPSGARASPTPRSGFAGRRAGSSWPTWASPPPDRVAVERAELRPTSPLGRLDEEVKRRADAAGILPGKPSITRLIGAVLPEADDERQLRHRHMGLEAMAELLAPDPEALRLPPLAA